MGVYLFSLLSATKLHFFLGVFFHFIIGADTAVSRAKQQVSLVGQKQALYIAIDRNDVDRRNTLLADRIVSYYRQMNAGKSKISA